MAGRADPVWKRLSRVVLGSAEFAAVLRPVGAPPVPLASPRPSVGALVALGVEAGVPVEWVRRVVRMARAVGWVAES
jgi:hypothetical protein